MTISVIIPAYNVESYIGKCISSVLAQSFKNVEVIIVDDGSRDSTAQICDCYASADTRVKVVHKENSGVSDARNVGLSLCTGNYICFLDADDWLEGDYFEEAAKVLQEKDCSILLNSWVRDVDNKPSTLIYDVVETFLMEQQMAIKELIMQRLFGWGVVATFYRSDVIKNLTFDREIRVGEDFYFKYQAIKNATDNIWYLPIHKYHYIIRNESAMRIYSITKLSDDLVVLKRVMGAENGEMRELLYYREYIPRIIEYAIVGMLSKDRYEIELSNKFRREALKQFFTVLISKKARRNTKIKMLILIAPNRIREKIGEVYIRYWK